MSSQQPLSRDEFRIAIVCALPCEYDAVYYSFDDRWDGAGNQYKRAATDDNHYTAGCLGNHNVVLCLLPHVGKVDAAAAVTNMKASFNNLRLALLVGVCGGVPFHGPGKKFEIILGDVVISNTVVQYDLGRQYGHKFVRKDTDDDNLGRPNKDIRGLLALMRTTAKMDQMEDQTKKVLRSIQDKVSRTRRMGKCEYPGMEKDKLYESTYRHKHHGSSSDCICSRCVEDHDPVCEQAILGSCADLKCDNQHLVPRERLKSELQSSPDRHDNTHQPRLFFGAVASADRVIKSARHRDELANTENCIAFEMEGAGIWDQLPCIVVKGVCDYADSHKNKEWQDFAAAMAASAASVILRHYTQTDNASRQHAYDPPSQRDDMQDRTDELLDLGYKHYEKFKHSNCRDYGELEKAIERFKEAIAKATISRPIYNIGIIKAQVYLGQSYRERSHRSDFDNPMKLVEISKAEECMKQAHDLADVVQDTGLQRRVKSEEIVLRARRALVEVDNPEGANPRMKDNLVKSQKELGDLQNDPMVIKTKAVDYVHEWLERVNVKLQEFQN